MQTMKPTHPSLSIKDLIDAFSAELAPTVITGSKHLDHPAHQPTVQQTGLALAGMQSCLEERSIQLFGYPELAYLRTLSQEVLSSTIDAFFARHPLLIVICGKCRLPSRLRKTAARHEIPILRVALPPNEAFATIHNDLRRALSPRCTIHGTLMDIFGVGVLMIGQSGVGKSESAMELIRRGHPLVADDVVSLQHYGDKLEGSSLPLVKNHIEIRGLGIVNIRDLFGIVSVRERKHIDLVIELVEWNPSHEPDRSGVEEQTTNILGITLPHLILPVRPGRNMGTIVELAARNELLKRTGVHTALALKQRLEHILKQEASGEKRP